MAYLGEEASFLGRISDACPGQLLPLSCGLTANLPAYPRAPWSSRRYFPVEIVLPNDRAQNLIKISL
jgi:hypothetical protein